jgi:hypothetical protein
MKTCGINYKNKCLILHHIVNFQAQVCKRVKVNWNFLIVGLNLLTIHFTAYILLYNKIIFEKFHTRLFKVQETMARACLHHSAIIVLYYVMLWYVMLDFIRTQIKY